MMNFKLTRHLEWGKYPAGHANHWQPDSKQPGKAVAGTSKMPSLNPPICPRDEAIFLLTIGSEVEHALMVQYLFAAFSLELDHPEPERRQLVSDWRQVILGIAREEMGHLITVQNMLHAIGGPLNFGRQDFPFDSALYPFTFELEPLSHQSLSKYVVAEMPDDTFLLANCPEIYKEVQPILAQQHHEGQHINRVGLIYQRVQQLFAKLPESEFHSDSLPFQASHEAWGLSDREIFVFTANSRAEARKALSELAEQGEGTSIDMSEHARPSHFERFLKIYRKFPKAGEWKPSRNIQRNPVTAPTSEATVTNPDALLWAQLSNQRYRMILLYLSHVLQVRAGVDPSYGALVSWCFGEMYNLRSISDILTRIPGSAGETGQPFAASPFELPYSLELPSRIPNKWRSHLDQIENARILIDDLLSTESDPVRTRFLQALQHSDREAEKMMRALTQGSERDEKIAANKVQPTP